MSASYPTSIKTFTTKNTNDVIQAAHIDDLQDEVVAVETDLLAGVSDYSATSTIIGWSSFTTKQIFYRKVGKLVHIWYLLAGTSNATTTSFTLPYSHNSLVGITGRVATVALDNGAAVTAPMGEFLSGGVTIAFYTSPGGAAWTGSGTKQVCGQFVYATD